MKTLLVGREMFNFMDRLGSSSTGAPRRVLLAAAVLVSVSVVAYLPFMHRIGLYLDDWRNIGDFVAHGRTVQGVGRPLMMEMVSWGWKLFGLNIQSYLFAAMLLHLLAALLLWFLLCIFLPISYQALALPAAVLFLTYPSNYLRIWLTGWPTGLLVAIILVGILAYVLFLRQDHIGWWLVSMILLGTSLLWYELQLGLIAGLSVCGIVQWRNSTWFRRFLILGPSLLAVLFTSWWFLAPVSSKTYGSNALLSVPVLVERLLQGYWTILVVAWIEPIRFLAPQPLARWQAIVLFGMVMLAIASVYLLLLRLYRPANDKVQPSATRINWLISVFLATAAVGLGFLPVLPLSHIGLQIIDTSRYTLFASLGAAALVVLLLYGTMQLLTNNHQSSMWFVYTASLGLVLLSIVYQWGAQRAMVAAWEKQKCAWHSILAQAPTFRDGTHVHILDVPAPSGIWGLSPFQHLLPEVDSALKLIYDNPSLSGSYSHAGGALWDGGEFQLTPEGIRQDNTGRFIPYDEVVVFRYQADNSLELLEEIPPILTGAVNPKPTGVWRILSEPSVSPYRRLIEPQPQCTNLP